jgi:hypothetical protein
LNPENLREEYAKALPYLALNGNSTKAKVSALEEENRDLKRRLEAYENLMGLFKENFSKAQENSLKRLRK